MKQLSIPLELHDRSAVESEVSCKNLVGGYLVSSNNQKNTT